MSNFEMEKKEYLEKLSKNMYVVDSMIDEEKPESLKFSKVLVEPKNEKELMVASSTVKFFIDYINLLAAIRSSHIEKIPVEENEGLKAISNMIKRIYNDEEVKDKSALLLLSDNESGKMNQKRLANIIFSWYASLIGDSENSTKYMMDELKLSVDSEIDVYKFKIAFLETQAKMNEIQPSINNDIDKLTADEVIEFVEFTDEFHDLCDKYIIKDVLLNHIVKQFVKSLQN